MNIGLERPLDLVPGKNYNIRIIIDDTIATLYVDGVALNTRMYSKPGDSISMFVDEGTMAIDNCSFSNKLNK